MISCLVCVMVVKSYVEKSKTAWPLKIISNGGAARNRALKQCVAIAKPGEAPKLK